MYYKSWAPIAIFSAVVGLPFYSFSNSLDTTVLDSSFFQDPNLFNKLENNDFVYKNSIEEDATGIKNYFFNNSFNLLWKKSTNGKDAKDDIFGNAFLINIMYPDYLRKDDPNRYTYTPKYYQAGETVTLLVGTSFSFVSKVFKGLGEWDKVNECDKVITLDKQLGNNGGNNCPTDKNGQGANGNGYEFYFSHPYPEDNEKTGAKQQENLYSVSSDYLDKQEFQINKPHFVKIDNKDVGLVYAALDLKVNKKLVNISLNSGDGINRVLHDVHTNTKTDRDNDFQSDIQPNWLGSKYKFAADFAVLQLKVKMKDIRGLFREYLRELYKKEGKVTKIPRNNMSIRAGKTDPLYLAGWSAMTQEERQQHEVDNLLVEAKAKGTNGKCNGATSSGSGGDIDLKGISPNEIKEKYGGTATSLGDCLELNLKNSKEQNNDKYEATDFEYYPNDEDGFLFVDYHVREKNGEKKKFLQKRSVVFDGFKVNNATAKRDFVKTYNDNHRRKSEETRRFLKADPTGMAEWKELSVQYGYFPIQNINDKVNKLSKKVQTNIDTSTPLETFKAGDNTYVNISHQINIPNLGLSQAKGIMALMKDPDSDQNLMVGMYEGSHVWKNPIGLEKKSVGKVMLFISPWRYDLFNANNKLSKPSLGDSLGKKKIGGNGNGNNMKDYLIYGNVFNLGS